MTIAVVVGYGSIGQRHVRLLEELGCKVAVVSRRQIDHTPCYQSIAAVMAALPADYVVIANETSEHTLAVEELMAAGFRGRLLIEKPLGSTQVCNGAFSLAAVAYNLRFHPVMAALADEVAGDELIAMQVYCGQYLPEWRPGTDYRKGYSADATRGGGVLRDLSHELDYLLWLGGGWRRVTALGGRLSSLDIRSDDCWAILLELERCPVATVQINYLDRPGRRQLIVNTAKHTYCADLGRALFVRDGVERSFAVDRDESYLAEHRAILSGDTSRLCSIFEAVRVMRLIAAAELANTEASWVFA